MQKIVHRDGKSVRLNTENDERLYAGHLNTGPRQSRWIDFHAHRLKSAGKLNARCCKCGEDNLKPYGEDMQCGTCAQVQAKDNPRPEDYVFYLAHYSCWQGENTYIQEITLDEAREFAAENYEEIDYHLGLLDESKFE